MSQARIGRFRMKAGGPWVRVLRRETPAPGGENYRGVIIANAREMAADTEHEIVGYFMMAVYADGRARTSWRHSYPRCPIPRKLFPAYIEEMAREAMISRPMANDEAVDVYNNQRVR